jgi:hypothetical protein
VEREADDERETERTETNVLDEPMIDSLFRSADE